MFDRVRFLACLLLASLLSDAVAAQPSLPDPSAVPPLSPAQAALFDTPHLANVSNPETLHYAYRRTGPGSFNDTISVRVKKVNSDGSKDLSFDFLTGTRHVFFPELDDFHGNPLLMLALEHDVTMMHDAIGLSNAYLRNRIREAFLDAPVSAGTTSLPDGKTTPATVITLEPFLHDERLNRIGSLQQKTYRFVLASAIPGMIAEIDIDTPEDSTLHAPALSDQITFVGVEP